MGGDRVGVVTMIRVCFVCLGNICRSPTAEAVMAKKLADANLKVRGQKGEELFVELDSAGTAAHHVGQSPDPRSSSAALRRGVELGGQARQWQRGDWQRFDYVLPVDRSTYRELEAQAPEQAGKKLRLLRSFDPASETEAEVPDPYYGAGEGFEHVLDLCEAACDGLLQELIKRQGLEH